MQQLSELAEVFAGITTRGYEPQEGEAIKQIRLYQVSQCSSAIEGQLSAPRAVVVSESFKKKHKQMLRQGDILLPSRFTQFGCGINDSKEDGIYASENVFVLRAKDPTIMKFLPIYFLSEDGKAAIDSISKAIASNKGSAINASDLRSLTLPDFTKFQMLKAIEIREQIIETRARLDQQAGVLNQLIADPEKQFIKLLEKTKSSPDLDALQMSQDALAFLSAVEMTDISASIGEVKVAVGKSHSIVKTGKNTCIVENIETGGLLVVCGNEVLINKGITATDKEKFRQLAKTTVDFLQPSSVSTPTEVGEELALD